MSNQIQTGDIVIGRGSPLVLVSGPCVIEDYETTREIAVTLKEITSKLEIPFIFKASYDKANRTSIAAFRGPGLNDGLRVLKEIKEELDIPILSDVHRISEIPAAARICSHLFDRAPDTGARAFAARGPAARKLDREGSPDDAWPSTPA